MLFRVARVWYVTAEDSDGAMARCSRPADFQTATSLQAWAGPLGVTGHEPVELEGRLACVVDQQEWPCSMVRLAAVAARAERPE